MITRHKFLLLLAALAVASPAAISADPLPSSPCDTTWQRQCRAGNPQCLAPWARCSYDRPDRGYYVGGGRPARRGDGPCLDEGTWGLDYAPWYSRVNLSWWHGRRPQGGTGQYEPDHVRHPSRHANGH